MTGFHTIILIYFTARKPNGLEVFQASFNGKIIQKHNFNHRPGAWTTNADNSANVNKFMRV